VARSKLNVGKRNQYNKVQ